MTTNEDKVQIVKDRLKGWDTNELKRIRNMQYYQMWNQRADWIEKFNPGPAEILHKIHWAKDEKSYGYAWKSEKSLEALNLVCRERGWQ